MLVFTSCVANYIPKARILAQSLKKWHPDWPFYLLLADALPKNGRAWLECFDRVLTISDLGLENWRSWMFQYGLVELCTALKGAALKALLEQERAPAVLYLDPDIMVFNSLDIVDKMLAKHDIVLTPHQISPQAAASEIMANELVSLKYGVFNLGFLACRNSGEGRRFASFWWRRLERWCLDAPDHGLFTDQKWCDLAPAFFPTLGILRDAGCNVASWNLSERKLVRDAAGKISANGVPLRFYHFTGHDSGAGLANSRKYAVAMPVVLELWRSYAELLRGNGQEELGYAPWHWGAYEDGRPIPLAARRHYQANPALALRYPDPYVIADGGYAAYWRKRERRQGLQARLDQAREWSRLARFYAQKHGGVKSLGQLAKTVLRVWRNGGWNALANKMSAFQKRAALAQAGPGLPELFNPARKELAPWQARLRNAFATGQGVLVIDHQYGGGANAYRDRKIKEFLAQGRPCLLMTWNFFQGLAECRFYLPGGAGMAATATGLDALLDIHDLRFGQIFLNELVLWSTPQYPHARHWQAMPELAAQILALKRRDAASLSIPLHDYYCICPSYTLLREGESLCENFEDCAACCQCLPRLDPPAPADLSIARWRSTWNALLAEADEIIAFSEASLKLVRRVHALDARKTTLAPHAPLAALAPLARGESGRYLTIGVPGHITLHKGARIVGDLARLLADSERIVVLGEYEGRSHAKILATGPYRREDLPALCVKYEIDVMLVPSVWPETFCYTAQEAMQMNLPLVVFPLGAQAERTKNYARGKIAQAISAKAALEAIRELGVTARRQ